MSVENSILYNMIVNGSVRREETMDVIISPDIKITFERFANQMQFSNETKYIIEAKLINRLGVILYTFRFSEIDAIRILDCIDEFQFDFNGEAYSNILIELSPNNTFGEIPYLFFQWGGVDEYDYDKYLEEGLDGMNVPDILFEIRQYSPKQQTFVCLYRFCISEIILGNFAFAIFFTALIDIVQDLPMRSQSEVENIVSNMFERGCF